MSDQLDVVERVLQILEEGAAVSTYKYAVLLGLMDLCLERTDRLGWPPSTVTTRELAEAVLRLYWPQVRTWQGDVLYQAQDRRARIPAAVEALRKEADGARLHGAGLARVRARLGEAWERTVRDIEWKLIEMPLPKLQRVGGQDTGWLYRIGWDDGPNRATEASVRAYQHKLEGARFDNRILLLPDVSMAFVRLYSLLRPFVEQRWTQKVIQLNARQNQRLNEYERLREHLFGAEREDLSAVRPRLTDLQGGACFYCDGALGGGPVEVDHFIPWSRHPDDGLENLVAAHAPCNNAKRDFLPGVRHLERWRARLATQETALRELSEKIPWDLGLGRTLGTARAIYLRLPSGARLWDAGERFDLADPRALAAILA